jgi:hypothetical protein
MQSTLYALALDAHRQDLSRQAQVRRQVVVAQAARRRHRLLRRR